MDNSHIENLDENFSEKFIGEIVEILQTNNHGRFRELMEDPVIMTNIENILIKIFVNSMIYDKLDILDDIYQFQYTSYHVIDVPYICSQVIKYLYETNNLELLIYSRSANSVLPAKTIFNEIFMSPKFFEDVCAHLMHAPEFQFGTFMENFLELVLENRDAISSCAGFDINIFIAVFSNCGVDLSLLISRCLNTGYTLSPRIYGLFIYDSNLARTRQLIEILMTYQIYPSPTTLITLLVEARFEITDILVNHGVDIGAIIEEHAYVYPREKYERIVQNINNYGIPTETFLAAIENYYLS